MVDVDEREEQTEQVPRKKKKGSIVKWLIIFFALILVASAGFAGLKYYRVLFPAADGETNSAEESTLTESLWSMGTIIVNLIDEEGRRYLKTEIQIEVTKKEAVAELDIVKPKVMDSILDLLSSKSYKEIVGYEAKQRLRDEIAERVTMHLRTGSVKKVYFTEFIIQ